MSATHAIRWNEPLGRNPEYLYVCSADGSPSGYEYTGPGNKDILAFKSEPAAMTFIEEHKICPFRHEIVTSAKVKAEGKKK